MRLPRAFLVYSLFVCLSFLILLTNVKIPSATYLAWRNFILHLYAPALWSADEFARDSVNLPGEIMGLIGARNENVILKNKILEYEKKLTVYDAIVAENDFLRRTAALPPRAGFTFVVAEVIMRDPAGWSLSCVINKGSAAGVRKNSAAVLIKNDRFVLAGKVVDTSAASSEVMLLTNPLFAVPAVVPASGCEGLLEYLSPRALALNYPSLLSAPAGSEVVVGKMSRIFPPGVLVGRVSDNRDKITVSPEFLKLPLDKMVIIVRK